MTATPDRLIGAPEWRDITDYETRAEGHEFVVRGYASLFDSTYPVNGGPDLNGWDERVDRRAFEKTLAANPDVHFLINHTGRSLARTKSGTLALGTDRKGLLAEARVDRRTQDGHDLEISMERGDLDEMSFAFRTVRHDFSKDGTLRTLLEVNIDKGDVSVVNNGANPHTRIRITDVKEAVRALAAADLAEVRGMGDDTLPLLEEARGHLNDLIRGMTPEGQRRMTLAEALRVVEGRD
jgi:HK97 family phage prohead protease